MTERKKWTADEERQLLDLVNSRTRTMSACFLAVAQATGRSAKAVSGHYYKSMRGSVSFMADAAPAGHTSVRKWTEEEEQRLIRQVRAFPSNLKKCFMIVSEEIGRTPLAVGSHWYTKTSKRDEICFFTASARHVAKNRKNGKGVESNLSIWKRLIAVLKSLHV